MILTQIVKQIVVKVVHPGLLQLSIEDLLHLILIVEEPAVELGRQSESVALMPGSQRLTRGVLTFETAIHPRGIKIRKSPIDEMIDQLLGSLDVDMSKRPVRCGFRQTHQPKSKLFASFKNIPHDRDLLSSMCGNASPHICMPCGNPARRLC